MSENLLIVEDEFIVANNLRLVLEKAGYAVCGIAVSVDEAREMVASNGIDLVLLDIHLKGKLTGIDLARELKEKNIAFVYLSANSNQNILEAAKATEPYGFLVKPYREKDVLITLDIARYRHQHSLESKLRQETILGEKLRAIGAAKTSQEEKLRQMAEILQAYIPFDFLEARWNNTPVEEAGWQGFSRIGYQEYQAIATEELSVLSGHPATALNKIIAATEPVKAAAIYGGKDFTELLTTRQLKNMLAKTFHLESELVFPVFLMNGNIFTLSFFSRMPDIYVKEHLALLLRLQAAVAAVAEKMTTQPGNPLEVKEKASRQPENEFARIIGSSPALLKALDLVARVAPLDTSVLILGESGTGKERIADSIHRLSPRKNMPLVRINCGALPDSLIESELFGHEKGAFTGATERKTGKFELASGGTVFLDEIGELPAEQQVKLLRVLQEKEIERIGGKQPVKVDVRVIAATNRNLEKEVGEGRFRLDLYYRLNVFPVHLPALAERKEDIAQLANYFAGQFSKKIGKPFLGISAHMLQELEGYHWPGNIRELENIIEQSLILNDGKTKLELLRPLPQARFRTTDPSESPDNPAPINSLEEIRIRQQQSEKEYICSILRKTKGRIRGKGGAAELLNQKPTTLESRIARLGIRKEDFYN